MNIPALVFFVLVVACPAIAQDYEYEQHGNRQRDFERREFKRPSPDYMGFLVFNLNAAIPLGDYGSKDLTKYLDDRPIGFATTGLDINLNVGRYFLKWLGINATAGYIKNAVEMDEIVTGFQWFYLSNGFSFENYSNKGYHQVYGTIGPVLSARTPRFAFEFSSQVGVAYAIDTEESVEISDGIGTVYITRDAGKFPGIAVQEGVVLRANVTSAVTFSMNLGYKYAKFKIKETSEHYASPNTPTQSYASNGRGLLGQDLLGRMHVLTVGMGLGLLF